MRTSPQHSASREVAARILSLEDVCPEARCSHRPGADRRVLSSLSCHTCVSVKQQLAADSERSSSHGPRAQLLEQAVLSAGTSLGSNPASPGKSHNRGDATAPHGKTRNSPGFISPVSPCLAGSAGPSWNLFRSLGRGCPSPVLGAAGWSWPALAEEGFVGSESPEMLRSRSCLCGPGRSLPPWRGVHVLGSVCFCLQLCLIGNSTL